MLTDLHGFTTQGLSDEYRSELAVEIDGQLLQVGKDFATGKVTVEPTGAQLPAWVNSFILVPAALGANYDELLSHLILNNASPSSPNSEQVKSELLALGDENIAKLLELEKKIAEIDQELGKQKRKDEITLSLGEIEKELTDTEEKISSVGDLIVKKNNLDAALAKFGAMVQRDLEGESGKLREQIAQIRQQQLSEMVADAKVVKPLGLDTEEVAMKRHGVWAIPLLGMVIVSIVVGILAFLFTQNTGVLAIGIVAALVELVIFGIINMLPLQVSIPQKNSSSSQQAVDGDGKPKESRWKSVLQQIEGFFVGKAWVGALRTESEEVGAMVSKRLDGQSVEDLEKAKQMLQQNVANLRLEVDKLADAEIPPQEYLEKRRELDMLKLDKTRVERDLRGRDDYDDIADKLLIVSEEQGGGAVDGNKVELPSELTAVIGINSLRNDSGQIVSEPTVYTEVTSEQKYVLVQWLRISQWEQDPSSPLVIVDGLTNQAENIKLVMQKRLSELHALGQIVLINLLP